MPRPEGSRVRREEVLEPKKVLIVATEDSRTGGYAYFEEFSEIEKYRFLAKYSFTITTLPSVNGLSSPKDVLENIKNEMRNRGVDLEGAKEERDSFWIICDIDRWQEEHIQAVIEQCTELQIDHAFSNPCFEIWILYHQERFNNDVVFSTSGECKTEATKLVTKRNGYLNLITQMHVQYAARHAEEFHQPKTDQWPKTQGSHVYKLIKLLGI
jgi:hypothetical protein